MYRNELKYVINPHQQKVISRRLSLLCEYDSHAPKDGAYTVSSLYLDDYQNSAFTDKLYGVLNKKKFRIRIYNGSDVMVEGWAKNWLADFGSVLG